MILASAALAFKRSRVIVFLNYWFAPLVAWNLLAILTEIWTLTR